MGGWCVGVWSCGSVVAWSDESGREVGRRKKFLGAGSTSCEAARRRYARGWGGLAGGCAPPATTTRTTVQLDGCAAGAGGLYL